MFKELKKGVSYVHMGGRCLCEVSIIRCLSIGCRELTVHSSYPPLFDACKSWLHLDLQTIRFALTQLHKLSPSTSVIVSVVVSVIVSVVVSVVVSVRVYLRVKGAIF